MLNDEGDPYIPAGAPVTFLTDSDVTEWQKMMAYTPAPAGMEAAPWWQNLVSYGVTKAIDNTFPGQQAGIQGNTAPGSFAGQNGRTYNQRGSQTAPPTLAAQSITAVAQSLGGWPVVLAGLGIVALLLRKG